MDDNTVTVLGTLGGTVIGGLLGFFGNWLNARWHAKAEKQKQAAQDEREYRERLRQEYAAWLGAISEQQMRLSYIPMLAIGDAEARKQGMTDLMQVAQSGARTQAFGLTLLERDKESRERIEAVLARLGDFMTAVVEESLKGEPDVEALLTRSGEFQHFLGQTVAQIRQRSFTIEA